MPPKTKRGASGVKDLRNMNLSLLCKWWWKLESGKGTLQGIVEEKYVMQKLLTQLKRNHGNSQAWNDLLKVNKVGHGQLEMEIKLTFGLTIGVG